MTKDERNKLDQKVAEYDEQYGKRVTDVANALSTWLGMEVTRHQVYALRKTKSVAIRKARNELQTDQRPAKLEQVLWDIVNFDVADFADLYPDHVRDTILALKKEGKPTYLIKEIVMGGTDSEEVKNVKYHDVMTAGKMLSQLWGLLKENNNIRIGTLQNVVVRGDDVFDNAARQLDAIEVEVSDADV